MNFKVITDYLPENGGQFYTLAKQNDKWGSVPGTNNWLSDTTTVATADENRSKILAAALAFTPLTEAELEEQIE